MKLTLRLKVNTLTNIELRNMLLETGKISLNRNYRFADMSSLLQDLTGLTKSVRFWDEHRETVKELKEEVLRRFLDKVIQ